MLELVWHRLADSDKFPQVAVCESLEVIKDVAPALDDGSVVIVPWQEGARPSPVATGGHRQLVSVRFVAAIVLRRHGDPQGAERAIAFDAHRKKLEALLAGWEPSEDHDCCDLVGAEVTGLGNGVSIYAQTWQTSRILTGE